MNATTTLHGLLGEAARTDGDKTFLRCASESGPAQLSFAELEHRSRRVASGLRRRGIQPGDRIAIAAPNQAEWLELFFGATRIGAVVVTLNVRYRQHELDYMLNHSGARMVVTAAADGDTDLTALYDGIRDRAPSVEQVYFLGGHAPHYAELLDDEPCDEPGGEPGGGLAGLEEAVHADHPAVILYTSGTTGRPKGATLTHGSIAGAALAQVQHLGTTSADVYVGVMPLNHVGGITCTITAALATRSTIVLLPGFSPAQALEAMAVNRATLFAGVPTMWNLMLAHDSFGQHDTSCLRTAVIGGANADPELCAAIVRGFPQARLRNLYGLSEVSGACVLSHHDDDLSTVSRTLGVALPGVEIRVTDLDGNAVPAGEDGELLVRGPGTARGYWNDPDETARTFHQDGWVATGDMVSVEPDGHITLRGRRKEMYVQGGYNVYPVEVENLLLAHPDVAMAAGIGVPDNVLGEIGQFYIVRRPDTSVTAEELTRYCKRNLADYKVPRRIVFVDDLPLTPAGKIAKSALREDNPPSR